MTVKAITGAKFDDVLEAHNLVLIDFWASWCGPCKGFSKVLEQVAPNYPDCFFGSVDIENESELAKEFAVRSVPFVMIIRDRVIVYAQSGALSKDALCELLDQAKALDAKQLAAMTDSK